VDFKLSKTNLVLLNFGLVISWLLAYGVFDVTILNERVLLYLMILVALINFLILDNKEYGSSKSK
jgi:hypothetical protein